MTATSIEPVARALLGNPNRARSTRTDWRYGRKGSLAVDLKKNTWFDHEVGEGGGVLDLVCRENGGTRQDAWAWLSQELGVQVQSGTRVPPATPAGQDGSCAEKRAAALVILEESVPAIHTPGQDYLACRGITIQPPPCIRYHAGINALVALVQAKDGSFSGIQRIYLETDARGTWRRSRYSLGPIKGGAVRLTPAAEILQLTESVEDGLALLQMTGRATWAVPGAGFMESFEPPPEVKELVLAPDHDPAGLEAIEKVIKAATNRSLKLRRLLPPPGKDWCDVFEDFDERMAIQEEPDLANSWADRFCNGV